MVRREYEARTSDRALLMAIATAAMRVFLSFFLTEMIRKIQGITAIAIFA
ncbi:hypothetical protein [Cupriavidus basilensis]|uniref:Uncharacterized protein n=1 Tax=Cupriavidus basilensis TaxID=68895 RepID=A0A7M2HBQ3_9BURK|nr:hypothetical protein [Cupriavidus basilensis]QOT81997.1 hypothetical protein F7R26_039060 [Cupriavidus basilensis]